MHIIIIIIIIITIIIITTIMMMIKILFLKNCNSQKQVYTMQHLELETGKTYEACSIVHWEGASRRP